MKKKTKESSIPATLSISRVSHLPSNEGLVHLSIRDKRSHIQFIDAEIPMAIFANAITGLGEVPIRIRVQGLPFVGKYKQVEHVSITLSKLEIKKLKLNQHTRENLEQYLVENYQKDGWFINPYRS